MAWFGTERFVAITDVPAEPDLLDGELVYHVADRALFVRERVYLDALGGEHEARFFTCHVCGDNWLSVKQTDFGGDCRITFVHQMGMKLVQLPCHVEALLS